MQTRANNPVLGYITRTFVREPAWMQSARAEGERRQPGMQISAYEGYLLRWLARMNGAKNVLEIGTFMGISTLWIAEGLSKGHITTLEFNADHAQAARAHIAASPHANTIEVVHTDAHDWLATAPLKPTYDLVFIDADKPGYASYLEAVLPRLNKGGLIIGDNTLLFGVLTGENPGGASEAAKASMTKFNQTLADPQRFDSILLPTPEGLTVARLR
jgi:caffeoyl-CoA O-methyltransferase